MRPRDWNRIVAALLASPIPFTAMAHAETYLTEDQAAAVLFPGLALAPRWVELTPEEAKAVQKASHERVLERRVRILTGPGQEAVIVDQVVGKHEFITYAVGINPDGKVKGVEIMDYRETYGYQVREKDWRAQFTGKNSHDILKVDKDIRNISGATLSSVHVTNGVRRVLQTYEIIKAKA